MKFLQSNSAGLSFLIVLLFILAPSISTKAQGTITLEPNNISTNSPSSYVIGIQRNHIFAQVKDPSDLSNTSYSSWFSDMLSRYKAIQPNFGNGKKLYRLSQLDRLHKRRQHPRFEVRPIESRRKHAPHMPRCVLPHVPECPDSPVRWTSN